MTQFPLKGSCLNFDDRAARLDVWGDYHSNKPFRDNLECRKVWPVSSRSRGLEQSLIHITARLRLLMPLVGDDVQ